MLLLVGVQGASELRLLENILRPGARVILHEQELLLDNALEGELLTTLGTVILFSPNLLRDLTIKTLLPPVNLTPVALSLRDSGHRGIHPVFWVPLGRGSAPGRLLRLHAQHTGGGHSTQ